MSIPSDFIRSVISAADLIQIVGGHVKLKKSGRNYTGLCPFHAEKTPSFSVVPEKGFYHCFGCGANGNALHFMMKHEGKDFLSAVEELAAMAGMTVPKGARSNSDSSSDGMEVVLKSALLLWRNALAESSVAKDYLLERGLTPETVNRFRLAYAPDSWGTVRDALAKEDSGLLVRAGLLREKSDNSDSRPYDYFRNRIMFPIFDERSRLCGFAGRVLNDDEPKYLNSPETTRFSKRRLLFGLEQAASQARKKNRLLITEGYMDTIVLAQAGFEESVATMGTAATTQQMEKALRIADNIIFAFDGDDAGRRAVGKALEGLLPALSDGKLAFFLFLPKGEDPDSFVRTHGAAAFEEKITSAPSLPEFFPDWLLSQSRSENEEGKAIDAMKEGTRLLRLLNSAVAPFLRDRLVRRLTEHFGVQQKTVLQAAAKQVSQRGRAVYKMRSGTRIYDLLCCLAIRPQLFEFFQKDSIPLFGDDEDVKIIDSVLSYIHKEDTDVEETIDIISFLDKGGWNSLAQQVRQGINGHFSAGSDIEAEFHALVAALWKEYGKEMPTLSNNPEDSGITKLHPSTKAQSDKNKRIYEKTGRGRHTSAKPNKNNKRNFLDEISERLKKS